MNIKELKIGDKVKVLGFSQGESTYRSKMLAMGLIPGVEFTIKRIAPLGDPLEIEVRGFSLILRKNEADVLKIEKLE